MKGDKNRLYFIIILIIIISIFVFIYNIIYDRSNANIEIVISRYNENLQWIENTPFNRHPINIYNKGKNQDFKHARNIKSVVTIPNLGRESHSYLYHIIENYNNLADITVFLPGSCDLEAKYKRAVNTVKAVEQTHDTFFYDKIQDLYEEQKDFEAVKWQSTYDSNKIANNENQLTPANLKPYGVWFKWRFGDAKVNQTSWFGIFAVHRRDILKHPKQYYQELLDELSVSSNPEVGHYYERSWSAIFHPNRP